MKTKLQQLRIAKKKLWQQKSLEIRKLFNNKCAICNRAEYLDVHHIIPRTIKELMYDTDNLICLCKKHHRFCNEISAHKNSFAFMCWLTEHYEEQVIRLAQKFDDVILKRAAKI